jgi:aspartate racemase
MQYLCLAMIINWNLLQFYTTTVDLVFVHLRHTFLCVNIFGVLWRDLSSSILAKRRLLWPCFRCGIVLQSLFFTSLHMKTIGLIGGMSWESTQTYYRAINELVKQRLGGLHSAKIILFSVDFAEIEALQMAGDWQQAGEILARAAHSLQLAGADFLVLATNTMHKIAPAIEAAVTIPLLHIADPTAEAIKRAGLQTIALLGTGFTMEQDFYRGRLQSQHGINVLIPDAEQRQQVHRIIYDELCLGVLTTKSRSLYRDVIASLIAQGAQGIILGCTEISLLVTQADASVPLFDTTALHAHSAVAYALENS